MQRHPSPMTHTPTRWAWTGAVIGLVLAFITQAPAHWLTHAIEQATGERVLLPDAQGTVWNGTAQWVLNEGPLNIAATPNTARPASTTTLPTRVTWQLGPRIDWTNFRVSLSATVASACCTPQPVRVDVSPVWRGLRMQMSDHTSNWPANWLVGLGAPWNTVQPEGQMQLHTTQLQWTQQAGKETLYGQVELQMQQLSTRLSTLRPLGSYRVRVQGGDTVALTLDTLEGSLLLQGTGQLINGRVQFNGEASAASDAEAALSNLLNILGQRQGAKSILKMG
ncbi:general secretion pathway protein GspN [Limnohabitans sp. MORI2]|uniref:type II secretion system protein N n=1 Tax=Limnohabitans sp. MORI2 TaxID=1751150 RepID=UPI002377A627|nr:type II secretion system protein N [Limnohabitans sp. MORI2]BDU57358.1 general secretion pathway protein GspN [Limnohabitans sp. MORI2]